MNFAGAILDAAPDAILVVEADGVIVVANRAAEALFGHAPLTGRAIAEVIPTEQTGRRADGSEFPAEIHRAELGLHRIAIVRDVTARRRLESERLRSLQTVSDVALRGLPPDRLLQAVLDPVGDALDAPLVAISMRDHNDGMIRVRAARGLRRDARGYEVRLGEGVAGRIVAGGADSYAIRSPTR
jgi:PAS domain-containing protein